MHTQLAAKVYNLAVVPKINDFMYYVYMDSSNSSSQFAICYLREKGPMGSAPYSGPRLEDGPIADI